jgi:hypothetical protein
MWTLRMRDNKIRQWVEAGEVPSIEEGARRVLELENDPDISLFFRVYADKTADKSDAQILSRLEYQGSSGFYVLTRRIH